MRRLVPFFLTIYVLITKGPETIKASFDGMSQESIDLSLKDKTGITYQVVERKVFDAVLDPPPSKPIPDPVKDQAISDAKNASKTPTERLNALISVIDLK